MILDNTLMPRCDQVDIVFDPPQSPFHRMKVLAALLGFVCAQTNNPILQARARIEHIKPNATDFCHPVKNILGRSDESSPLWISAPLDDGAIVRSSGKAWCRNGSDSVLYGCVADLEVSSGAGFSKSCIAGTEIAL